MLVQENQPCTCVYICYCIFCVEYIYLKVLYDAMSGGFANDPNSPNNPEQSSDTPSIYPLSSYPAFRWNTLPNFLGNTAFLYLISTAVLPLEQGMASRHEFNQALTWVTLSLCVCVCVCVSLPLYLFVCVCVCVSRSLVRVIRVIRAIRAMLLEQDMTSKHEFN